MKTSRRTFIRVVGAGAATAALAAPAMAQSVIDEILSSHSRATWDDQFDARPTAQPGRVVSTSPVFSQQTVAYVEQTMAHYQNIVANGGWPIVPSGKALKLGVVDPDVAVLRRRLMISGDLAESAGISNAFDSYVDVALKRFQTRHGLPADGATGRYTYAAMNISADIRLGQLQTNLERLRNMPDTSGRFVMVNIPAAEIEAVENGRVASRHVAVVGKIDRQTPRLTSKIHEINLNPYWNAPESIVRRDIIPLMRKNPNYLKENNIHILGPNGEVDPLSIDWNTEEAAKLRFRQDPGRINAMASTKINFHNPHAVYLHDTPQQSLFNGLERFHSSGCVRVQNVRDLVVWILKETQGWDRRRIEQTIQTESDVKIPVANPVPIHMTYVSAWATDQGVAHFRDDIYGLDGVDALQISTL
ncbi:MULTISPECIES: L,D-transpeptidase family protein [unclassified Aminobacter]|uniref:L,D-transpeptidase family protein n=1 Tax=unclassified Aminobacter TaxID=2644704 RepID=UPI000466E516|nr:MULTISPECIES: L,D-transpeptidase family protein [unclassified Aminobacter]TWH35551.1 murein L,D-transpeptidase YcbB/YkuD [Aminobacter sp. J15]